MRLKEDRTSWKSSGIERRDFRHIHNGPEITGAKKKPKDTKRWCKGIEGREHLIVVRKGKNDHFNKGCHASSPALSWLNGRWLCYHERACASCGKIVAEWLGDACPDKP